MCEQVHFVPYYWAENGYQTDLVSFTSIHLYEL